MSLPSARSGAAALLLAISLAACGSGTENTPVAEAVAPVSGDAQSGSAGAALPLPLRVRVTGAGGIKLPGAEVSWVVTEGGGHLSASSARSDPSGTAQVSWTLGLSQGIQLVEARVGDLPPVIFSATAGPPDPCLLPVPYVLGSSVDGALTADDCSLPDGTLIDYYSFSVPAVSGRRFTLASDSFDTFLFVNNPAGIAVAVDNDGGDSTDASLTILLAAGSYQAGANALEPAGIGPYTLSSTTAPTSVDNCADIWIAGGVKVTQAITTTDCLDPTGPYYSDELLIWLDVRQLVTVSEHSADFDALVGLLDLSTGKFVASDDDSGPGRDALMSYTATHAGEFVLVATTFLADSTGAYTLDVETPASDVGAAAPGAWHSAGRPDLLRLILARQSAGLRRGAGHRFPRVAKVK